MFLSFCCFVGKEGMEEFCLYGVVRNEKVFGRKMKKMKKLKKLKEKEERSVSVPAFLWVVRRKVS